MQSGIIFLMNNIKISFTSGREKILHIIFFSGLQLSLEILSNFNWLWFHCFVNGFIILLVLLLLQTLLELHEIWNKLHFLWLVYFKNGDVENEPNFLMLFSFLCMFSSRPFAYICLGVLPTWLRYNWHRINCTHLFGFWCMSTPVKLSLQSCL